MAHVRTKPFCIFGCVDPHLVQIQTFLLPEFLDDKIIELDILFLIKVLNIFRFWTRRSRCSNTEPESCEGGKNVTSKGSPGFRTYSNKKKLHRSR